MSTMNTSRLGPLGRQLSRRSLLATLVVTPALGAFLAACGDDSVDQPGATGPDASGIAHPVDAHSVTLRFAFEGGLMPQGFAFVSLPNVLVSGDGRVFTPAPTTMQYPGVLVAPLAVRTITEQGIQKLLSLANQAGLLATPPDYTLDPITVADAPDTVVTFNAKGGSFAHRAYALGLNTGPDGASGLESTPARVALQSFVQLLADLPTAVGADQLGPESIFEPAAYRFEAYAADASEIEGIEPAPTVLDWPAPAGLHLADSAQCTTVSAADAGTLFADANANTFFREGGQLYRLAVAAVLPGDPDC